MKVTRNFVIAAAVFIICLAMWRLPSVKASGGQCCSIDYSTCTTLANQNKINCQNSCAASYPAGSQQLANCNASCGATYSNVEMPQCAAAKTSCESIGNNECYVYCMQHSGGYPLLKWEWKDGCSLGHDPANMDESCTCYLSVTYHPCDPATKPPWGNPTCDTTTGTWQTNSPILVDWKGEGFHLTSADNGVFFDFTGSGQAIKLSWTDPEYSNAWLALDRNGNGKIDDSKELFGNLTEQSPSKEPNGYLALAEFDKPANGGNDDGFIDRQDAIYSRLRLWIDRNHNGISEPDELHKLSELGIARLDLQYQQKDRTDPYGNVFRYRARVWNAAGERGNRWTWDVYLKDVQ